MGGYMRSANTLAAAAIRAWSHLYRPKRDFDGMKEAYGCVLGPVFGCAFGCVFSCVFSCVLSGESPIGVEPDGTFAG